MSSFDEIMKNISYLDAEKNNITSFDSLKSEMNLVKEINEILDVHGVGITISYSDLTITDRTVSDLVKQDKILSNAIVNKIWPSTIEKEVYHFTSKAKVESILNTNAFRFYNLTKRFEEGEIVTFCKDHDLDGYLEKDDFWKPKYKSLLMDNMYYASFSDTRLNDREEKYLKKEFASFQGVRLKLKITATNSDFRKIVYSCTRNKPISLLHNLSSAIKNNYNRDFILSGISRLCAFYLSGDFKLENEHRCLYVHRGNKNVNIKNDSGVNFIEVPLNTINEIGYKIEVLEIKTNENLNIPSSYDYLVTSA